MIELHWQSCRQSCIPTERYAKGKNNKTNSVQCLEKVSSIFEFDS